jgi:predicted Zn-dependent protease with MMP-like domain
MGLMERSEFERIVQEAFDSLPNELQHKIENVRIIIEDVPAAETLRKSRLASDAMLLGLYEGIPLGRRGEHYGMYPVVPDTITLYQRNIESVAHSGAEIREKIREVLVHEIAHYFGMTEKEIRKAGY